MGYSYISTVALLIVTNIGFIAANVLAKVKRRRFLKGLKKKSVNLVKPLFKEVKEESNNTVIHSTSPQPNLKPIKRVKAKNMHLETIKEEETN